LSDVKKNLTIVFCNLGLYNYKPDSLLVQNAAQNTYKSQ